MTLEAQQQQQQQSSSTQDQAPANRESEPTSFAQRKLDSLTRERSGEAEAPNPNDESQMQDETLGGEQEDAEQVRQSALEADDDNDSDEFDNDEDDNDEDDNGQSDNEAFNHDDDANEDENGDPVELEQDDLTERERELTAQAEKAETARANMEKDYRKKTAQIGEQSRELEQQLTQVQSTANFYANLAEQAVAQFQHVNWQELQTTRPQEFEQMRRSYGEAVTNRDRQRQALEQIGTFQEKAGNDAKVRQAQVSKGILENTIDGWGKDRHGEIRDFAIKELDYTAKEFDEIVDWRMLTMFHRLQLQQGAPVDSKVIKQRTLSKDKNVKKRKNKKPLAQKRDASGRFEAAKSHLQENPGDRGARHSMFLNRLQAERER